MKLRNRTSLSLIGDRIYLIEGRQAQGKLIIDRTSKYYWDQTKALSYSDFLDLDRLKFRRISISLDENWFTCDYIVLNNMKDKEVEKYLEEKYRGLDSRKIQYILSRGSYNSYISLMVISMEKKDLDRIKSLTSSYFIGTRSIGLNSYNLVKLLDFSGLINNHYKTKNKLIMNINLAYDYIDCLIFRNLEINYSSRIQVEPWDEIYLDQETRMEELKNVFHLDPDNPIDRQLLVYIERLKQHIKISQEYYNIEFNQEISYIVISGELAKLPGLDNLLTSSLNKQTIVLRTLKNVEVEKDLALYGYSLGGLLQGRKINHV